MAQTKKIKSAAANVAVPQDDAEMRSFIRELGDLTRELKRLETQMNDEIAKVKQRYGDITQGLPEQIAAWQEGIRIYAEANRARLTNGGKVKFHRFTTGTISWRTRPPKVSLRNIPQIIENVKQAGLTHFIRIKEEVNKDAMLDDPNAAAAIKGVTIGSAGEDFIIEPDETRLDDGAAK